jgi:hypothetical protein
MIHVIWPAKSDGKELGVSVTADGSGGGGAEVFGGPARIHAAIPWRAIRARPQPVAASPSTAWRRTASYR